MTFGQYLWHLCLMQKLPLDSLVAATSLDPGCLVDLKTDMGAPSLEDIAKLATALNLSHEGLLEKARYVRPSAF